MLNDEMCSTKCDSFTEKGRSRTLWDENYVIQQILESDFIFSFSH